MSRRRDVGLFQSVESSVFPAAALCLFLSFAGSAQAQETDLDAVRVRAEAHYQEGRWEEALSDFERLVSLYPEEGCLHGRLAGCALREPGRLAMARRHLRIAIRKSCGDVDLEFHRARLAQLEYDFERAADLYAAYLAAAGKKARFGNEAQKASTMCLSVMWSPDEAVGLQVLDRIPAEPDAAFRFYRPGTPGLRLVAIPANLRSKADLKQPAGRMAFHDGDTLLVFGSLGKKGQNGWDLYSISLAGGAYGDPTPLGDSINTAFNERDAFLSRDGILYFSSDRPGGFGGYDIYAVPWVAGQAVGAPERLPFPINSVNDDAFFIPEPDGGAWFASDRAAAEGRVHAFRVALSDRPFEAGTVAWVSEEVESEGFSLRVYQHGELLKETRLAGVEGEHQSISARDAQAGVRVVLVNGAGEIVSETYGQPDGAWELRKEGRGWNFEERIQPDWAMMADLQVGAGVAEPGEANVAAAEMPSTSAWGDWVQSRRALLADPVVESESNEEGQSESALLALEVSPEGGTSDAEQASPSNEPEGNTMAQTQDVQSELQSDQAEQTVVDIAIPETAALEVETKEDVAALELEPAASSEAVTPDGMEAQEEAEAGADSRPQTAEAWAEVVPDPEEVAQLRTENPELLQEVWEQKMEQVLVLETAFLDNPNMMLAGEVSDQVDALEAWQPNADKTRPDLQDAVDFEDIRDMLETWSAAVQSATKASLARVAGDAALAFRREKLALREWSVSGAGDLAALQANWAEHLDAQRNVPGADPGQANWTVEEGDRFFEEVKAVLEAGEATWSRKQRSGWRGDWVERQRSQWDQQLRLWEAERVELLEREAEALAQSEPVSEPMADVEEVPVEAQEESAVELIPVSDPFGEDGPETWIGFAFDGIGEELDGEEGAGLEHWANDVAASDEVQRAWQRFESAVGSSAVPQVASAEDLGALSPKVAGRWLDLRAAMLDAWGVGQSTRASEAEAAWRSEREAWLAIPELESDAAWSAFNRALEEAERLAQAAAETLEAEQKARALAGRWSLQSESLGESVARQEALDQASDLWEAEQDRWRGLVELALEAEQAAALEAEEAMALSEQAPEPELEEPVEVDETEARVLEEVPVMEANDAETPQDDVASPSAEPAANEVVVNWPFPDSWSGQEEAWRLLLEEVTAWSDTESERYESTSGALPEDEALLSAWREWNAVQDRRPGEDASPQARNQWEKADFFARKRFTSAAERMDLLGFRMRFEERQLAGEVVAELEVAPTVTADPVGSDEAQPERNLTEPIPEAPISPVAARVEAGTVETPVEDAVAAESPAVSRASRFGVLLPEAEVVGAGASPSDGVRIRPIGREEMERAILGRGDWNEPGVERAAEAFAADVGAPRSEGVEYKVQIGAFRNPLPAALFAAFDPMWAKTSASGITRYMAGSFGAYDPAVVARDAIRAMGYEDAFVVRFVDGERVRGARPAAQDLLAERENARAVTPSETGAVEVRTGDVEVVEARPTNASARPVPTTATEIETWAEVRGRVYSVQVGAFRGVPDEAALSALGTLTREDAGSDGWLRLFSGRFDTEAEARTHLSALQDNGRSDAFVVVYINGRRIPLLEASTTATGGLDVISAAESEASEVEAPAASTTPVETTSEAALTLQVQLGAYSSTIPVRLANAILDAPLEWEVRSVREGGLTRYVTRPTLDAAEAERWLEAARGMGFLQATVLREE